MYNIYLTWSNIIDIGITLNIVKTINHIQQLLIKQLIQLQHLQLNIVHLYNIHQLLSLEITCTTIINKVSIG